MLKRKCLLSDKTKPSVVAWFTVSADAENSCIILGIITLKFLHARRYSPAYSVRLIFNLTY